VAGAILHEAGVDLSLVNKDHITARDLAKGSGHAEKKAPPCWIKSTADEFSPVTSTPALSRVYC